MEFFIVFVGNEFVPVWLVFPLAPLALIPVVGRRSVRKSPASFPFQMVFCYGLSGFLPDQNLVSVLDLKLAARLFAHDDQRRQEPVGRFFHFSLWEIHPTDFFTETSGTSGFGGGSERSRHWATRILELFFALTTLFIFPQTFLNLWWDK